MFMFRNGNAHPFKRERSLKTLVKNVIEWNISLSYSEHNGTK